MHTERIELLEAQRIGLIHQLEKLNENVLETSIVDGNWSVNQILEHVILVEEQIVNLSKSRLNKDENLRPVSFKTRLRLMIMPIVLSFKVKFQSPSIVKPSAHNVPLKELAEKWRLSRLELSLLSEGKQSRLKQGLFKHPYIGFLNFSQILRFLQIHFEHHLLQLNRQVEQSTLTE